MTRSVAIVGTVNRDLIVGPNGTVESLGGILYNTIPLAALLEGTGVTVRPFARLGADDRREAVAFLRGFPGVDVTGLTVDPAGTNSCVLDYTGPGEREERVEVRVAPLGIAELEPAADSEAILVNMISGHDVTIATLAKLRSRCAGRFLLDVQALARTGSVPRRPRSVPDWRAWCREFDVVRGNEEEIGHFAGFPGDRNGAIEAALRAGAREVLVTLGRAGSVRGRLSRGTPVLDEIPAYPAESSGDPTGCGDAYLAGVCAGRILGLPGTDACHLGAWLAARVSERSGLGSLEALAGAGDRARAELPFRWPERPETAEKPEHGKKS